MPPYDLGYTRNTMAINRGKQDREVEQTPKSRLSSDCRLQLACMKSGIASNRGSACRGEYVPGPCTHRPSHHGESVTPEVSSLTAREGAAEGGIDDWGEVVTKVAVSEGAAGSPPF